MNIRNKENYIDTTNLRKGIVKVEPLREGAISQFRCTYEGTVCKNQATNTVHADYNKENYEWVCDEHVLWAINLVQNFFHKRNTYVTKRRKEDFILEHDLHFKYLGFDDVDYECQAPNKTELKCYGSEPKWEISITKMGATPLSKKDKNNTVITCSQHFKPTVKRLIIQNKGSI